MKEKTLSIISKNISLESQLEYHIDTNIDRYEKLANKMSMLEYIFYNSFLLRLYPMLIDSSDWRSYLINQYNFSHNIPNILLRCQYKVKKFRIDFAIIRKFCKIAIELDGFEYHDRDKNQFDYERERQNYLISQEWIVLRFTWQAVTERFDDVYCQIMDCIERECNKYYQEK